jgi:uncharacterized protein YceK
MSAAKFMRVGAVALIVMFLITGCGSASVTTAGTESGTSETSAGEAQAGDTAGEETAAAQATEPAVAAAGAADTAAVGEMTATGEIAASSVDTAAVTSQAGGDVAVQSSDGSTQVVTSTTGSATDMGGGQMQTEPQAGAGSPPSGTEDTPQRSPAGSATFSDSTYGFTLVHPADFVVFTATAEQLAQAVPTPVAGYRFMNPQTAASDIVDLEPADLEVRLYAAPAGVSLEQWLMQNGLLPADGSAPATPFQVGSVQGVEVCSSTMLAPGCFYFVLDGSWIYQLTPATPEGESMLQSFALS